jgi:hypothetical protein
MRRTVLAACAAAALLVLTACGGGADEPSADASGTPTPTASSTSSESTSKAPKPTKKPAPAGPVVDVTINGDSVTPNGDRVDAKVGEPVTLNITSDRAGELHVHSTPEQELEYGAGKTTLELTVDTPGVVDVEDHVADVVIVQLEVS